MEYNFFALLMNSPIYYTCKPLSPDQYELTAVAYSEALFEDGNPPLRLVMTRGKRWTPDDPWPKEFVDELAARITAWEKERGIGR